MKTYEYDKEFYVKFKKTVVDVMSILYRIEATGVENIPKDTNYMLVGNHLHIMDAGLITKYDDSYLRFLVNNKLYKKIFERYIFQKCGTIGIDQKIADLKAVKTMIETLKEYSMVVFPEGVTHKQDEYVPFKPGVAAIAKIAKVPIVPFGIQGTYIPFSKLRINFGTPIDFSKSKLNKNQMDIVLESEVRKLEKIKDN